MALHLYVGTLTRYYSGDWEPCQRGGGGELDPVEVEDLVLEWRDWANSDVNLVQQPMDWAEGAEPPYLVAPLTPDELGALQLWAAYAEHPDRTRPAGLPEDWLDDPVLALSMADDFPSRFPHLLFGVDAWLPVRMTEVFEAPGPCPALPDEEEEDDEELTRFGSVPALLEELEALNKQTWKADPGTIQGWRSQAGGSSKGLEAPARRAFAVFLEMARQAMKAGQPMVLHYQ